MIAVTISAQFWTWTLSSVTVKNEDVSACWALPIDRHAGYKKHAKMTIFDWDSNFFTDLTKTAAARHTSSRQLHLSHELNRDESRKNVTFIRRYHFTAKVDIISLLASTNHTSEFWKKICCNTVRLFATRITINYRSYFNTAQVNRSTHRMLIKPHNSTQHVCSHIIYAATQHEFHPPIIFFRSARL